MNAHRLPLPRDPLSHGMFRKQFARYGDPRTVAEGFERELASSDTFKSGSVTVTPHWLVCDGLFLEVLRLDKVIEERAPWAHFGYRDDLATGWMSKCKQVAKEVAARREALR